MDFDFVDKKLRRLYTDPRYAGDFSPAIVNSFRRKMNIISNATDERDLRAMKRLHFEKLDGDRLGQHSIKLNDQWRLILRIRGEAPEKTIDVVEITDYH